jgi:hypothetical protein
MSLPTLPKVQKLQDALHAKAKGSPKFRFYALTCNRNNTRTGLDAVHWMRFAKSTRCSILAIERS